MSDSHESAHAIERAREAALRILERRRRTRKELDDKLRQAGHDADSRREVIERLTRVGLVDDLEYARAYLREKLARRAVGDRVLQADLQRRGVPREVARQALAETRDRAAEFEGGAERARAARALDQLRRRYERLDPTVARRRLHAAMARRGFSSQLVESLLTHSEP